MQYQPIIDSILVDNKFNIDVLRLDQLHPEISGNKWFKLKRNLEKAKTEKFSSVLTFGGAFSNHIAATAATGNITGLKTIGIIRGHHHQPLNATLQEAERNGMHLHFVSHEDYAKKESSDFISELKKLFGAFYLIPEGGNNEEGILGCTEILKKEWQYDYIFCACGTGATYAGLLLGSVPESIKVGINVLKGDNKLVTEVKYFCDQISSQKNISIGGNEILDAPVILKNCISDLYAFNGYAKFSEVLFHFKNQFENEFKIPLDHIYTVKLFFAVFDLLKNGKIPASSSVLVIHSGGLQGNVGFEKRYGRKI